MRLYEIEFTSGLEEFVRQELYERLGSNTRLVKSHREDAFFIHYDGNVEALLSLRTVLAVYEVLRFDVPRPKALLGHQHFQVMLNSIKAVLKYGTYQSLYISAAGSDSSVMQRLKEELAKAAQLSVGEYEGDLWLRIRRIPKAQTGWEVLVRLSPRPLASRAWRVCDMEGALNASIAHVMVRMTEPKATDTFLNIACGSGTIMIERCAYEAAEIIGCDNQEEALDCARANFNASDTLGRVKLLHEDIRKLSLADDSVDALCADLPFGNLVGSHEENKTLYPAVLKEAARVARKGAQFIVISHEVRLIESCLAKNPAWALKQVYMINLTGLHPRIFHLERT